MKRERLTVEEHKQLALHIRAIDAHMSKILGIANGKVPTKLLDSLLSFRGIDKALQLLRSRLEDVMLKEIPEQVAESTCDYYGNAEASCITDIVVRDARTAPVKSPSSSRDAARHEAIKAIAKQSVDNGTYDDF